MIQMKHALVAGALLAAAVGAQAEVAQVRVWAAACANCHGTNGRAQPGMPSLAGTPREELLRSMLEYKNGVRPATIMHQLAKGYTDEQLAALAGYFAALPR